MKLCLQYLSVLCGFLKASYIIVFIFILYSRASSFFLSQLLYSGVARIVACIMYTINDCFLNIFYTSIFMFRIQNDFYWFFAYILYFCLLFLVVGEVKIAPLLAVCGLFTPTTQNLKLIFLCVVFFVECDVP